MKLIYFSRVREVIGKSSEFLNTKAKTLRELIEELQANGDEYSVLKGENFKVCFAVDQTVILDLDFCITDVTEIAFFPPMTGG